MLQGRYSNFIISKCIFTVDYKVKIVTGTSSNGKGGTKAKIRYKLEGADGSSFNRLTVGDFDEGRYVLINVLSHLKDT